MRLSVVRPRFRWRALRWWRPWPVAAINPGDDEEDDDG